MGAAVCVPRKASTLIHPAGKDEGGKGHLKGKGGDVHRKTDTDSMDEPAELPPHTTKGEANRRLACSLSIDSSFMDSLRSSSEIASLNKGASAPPPSGAPGLMFAGARAPTPLLGEPVLRQAIVHPELVRRFQGLKEQVDNLKAFALPRGGTYVKVSCGGVQFGCPPETIKDSMALGLDPPQFYVLPKDMFVRSVGISVAEFEFPAYFNFFVKRKKVVLIIAKEREQVVRSAFREALLGPEDLSSFAADFADSFPVDARPDLVKEINYFRQNPFNAKELMGIDTLISFCFFDEAGVATLADTSVQVIRKAEGGQGQPSEYVVMDGGVEVASVNDAVDLPLLSTPEAGAHDGAEPVEEFERPPFAVTFVGSSHGFDAKGSTNGFVIWLYGRGILVDPPPHSSAMLQADGIANSMIDTIILTHCHADHDAGTFQKVLEPSLAPITLITTETILASFVRKYCWVTGLPPSYLRALFTFRRVVMGEPLRLHGADFRFFPMLHAIPTVGFEVLANGSSMVFSSDTCYDPTRIQAMCEEGVLSEGRRDALLNFPFHHTLILHEQGVPPLHTPLWALAALPVDVRKRMYLVHTSVYTPEFVNGPDLRVAACGAKATIYLPVETPAATVQVAELLDLVASIELLRDVPLRHARDVLLDTTSVAYPAGDVICRQGDVADRLYVIKKGRVRRTLSLQVSSTPLYLGAGECFGEEAMRDDATSFYGFTAEATGTGVVELYALPRGSLRRLLSVTPRGKKATSGTGSVKAGAGEKGSGNPSAGGGIQDDPDDGSAWPGSEAGKRKALLHNVALSRMADGAQLAQLQGIMSARQLAQGEVLWSVGDAVTMAVVVGEGRLVFRDHEETEEEREKRKMGGGGAGDNGGGREFVQGTFFCDLESIVAPDGETCMHTTTVHALTSSRVYCLARSKLAAFFREHVGIQAGFKGSMYVL
eukprot:jgi/Mesvir1/6143/Mv00844-RA.1